MSRRVPQGRVVIHLTPRQVEEVQECIIRRMQELVETSEGWSLGREGATERKVLEGALRAVQQGVAP